MITYNSLPAIDCLSPAQEQPFCFYLVDLWTWDEGAGRCVSYRDCPGDYGALEKNAYYSLAECRVSCEFA